MKELTPLSTDCAARIRQGLGITHEQCVEWAIFQTRVQEYNEHISTLVQCDSRELGYSDQTTRDVAERITIYI